MQQKKAPIAQNDNRGSGRQWSKVKCYKYKKKGHIAKNCLTKQDDKDKDDKQSGGKKSRLNQLRLKRLQMHAQRRNRQGCRIGIGSENLEAWMYVRIKLNGEAATFLVDTGASISLLSAKLYCNLPHEQRPQLNIVSSKVLTAASTELPLKVKGSFKVEVAEITTYCCFTVAELSVDWLFGMDFLKRHKNEWSKPSTYGRRKPQFASQDLSPELKALLNETAHNLTLSQMENVEQLLRQYSGLFAKRTVI